MVTPGLIVAAPASGSGKTTLVLGLLRALRRAGMKVAAAKAGPDYIDPGFHAAAAGGPCLNLDCWAMRPATLAYLVHRLSDAADIVLCEGVMGLFDGADAAGTGSTADLAEATGWPVVLTVDVRGQAASAAALVAGFHRHRPGVRIAGVIFNRVGGPSHAETLRAAMAAALPEVKILGCVGRDPRLALPERHLGLVQAREWADLGTFLDNAADRIAAAVDLAALRTLAAPARLADAPADAIPVPPPGQRIAIARDDAFAFAYPALLDGWRGAGAEIGFFSPLADELPAADADAIYLPGGYPELHAARLAGNRRFLDGLRTAAADRRTIYGECGGYMVLGRGLVDGDGAHHAMARLLPLETSFAARRLHLGYRQAIATEASFLGPREATYRGHEFHYATVVDEGPGAPLFRLADAADRVLPASGRRVGSVMGSFIHLIDRA
ncbi:MAG: cobyrinate a,c-diamide synthase [Rhodospirillales bacterium]|nr:cobyrinate a,c-diamide synthase [Rhodospirillales bacterium]